MKSCSSCEIEFKGPQDKCSNCRGSKPMAISAKNFKWRVEPIACKKGHLHVPINGQCGICNPLALMIKYCKQCGLTIPGKRIKYCSDKCQRTAATPTPIDKECKHCEKQLHYGQDRFCSTTCSHDYAKNIRALLNRPI